jgi:hypothetical protein
MKVGEDHHLPKGSPCTSCGEMLDGATCVGNDIGPSPGDVTVCISCGHIMVFADDLSFRDPTDAEIVAIAGDPYVLMIQRARAAVANKRHQLRDKREDDEQ